MTARSRTTPRIVTAACVAVLFAGAGAALLHQTFEATSRGESLPLQSALLAAVWFVGGAAVTLTAGRSGDRLAQPAPAGAALRFALAVGAAFAVVCVVGALVLLHIPFFEPWVESALGTADKGRLSVFAIALVTGAGEEVFFRLGLRPLFPQRYYVAGTALVYAVVTAATANGALVVAAALLGVVAAESYRRYPHWVVPISIHALWTVGVIGVFPFLA